jgi:hypothetical protein
MMITLMPLQGLPTDLFIMLDLQCQMIIVSGKTKEVMMVGL